MDNRLKVLRSKLDAIIQDLTPEDRRYFFTRLYGVSDFAVLLAIRRGLNPEIAAACGMLHDIYPLTTGSYVDHGPKGAELTHGILTDTGLYTQEEIETIATAIARHSRKEAVHEPYDEILKDADVLHHRLYNALSPAKAYEEQRYCRVLAELGAIITEANEPAMDLARGEG